MHSTREITKNTKMKKRLITSTQANVRVFQRAVFAGFVALSMDKQWPVWTVE